VLHIAVDRRIQLTTSTHTDFKEIAQRVNQVIDEVEKVIIGKRETIMMLIASIMCNGHVLVEDVPGVGKTTLVKSLAKALGCSFKRIQFTPDLLPGDITGTPIFNQKTQEFEFRRGPVFAQFVLADEINRATPKTQSSLLECMEERQVTADGVTYQLPYPFFVVATENNVEYQGTYPLPEAQLDRFMMRLSIGYPGKTEESQIIDSQMVEHPLGSVISVLSSDEVVRVQQAVPGVFLETTLRDYIVEIVTATRHHPMIALGASPRGSLNLSHISRAVAGISGRDFVLPDDIKKLAEPVLAHRLILRPEARIRNITAKQIIGEILANTPVPA
jgi:MoxR-like ATPase